jgi:hypothetical protein
MSSGWIVRLFACLLQHNDGMSINRYRCGLCVGQLISLKEDLVIRGSENEFVRVIQRSQPWSVIGPGYELISKKFNDSVLWLRDPTGVVQTWDDDESVFETFEVVGG